MRPGGAKKGSSRLGWPASLVARQVGGSLAPWGYCWAMPGETARPYSIARSRCRKHGRTRARAGGPAKPPWATKPQLARPLLTRAFDARVPMAGGMGESGYGKERRRRVWWAEQHHA